MSNNALGIPHLSAPVGTHSLFDFAIGKAKKAADRRRRADEKRAALDLATSTYESLAEHDEMLTAAEAVEERKKALLSDDPKLVALKNELKRRKSLLSRTEAARAVKSLSKEVDVLDTQIAQDEREIARSLASGEVPIEARASAAVGADVVLPGKDASAGMD